MEKIVIIKTGDTFPAVTAHLGDFEDWIARGLGLGRETLNIVDAAKGDPLPCVDLCKAVVIAGSHAMVTQNLSWSVAIEQWIPDLICSQTPVLGICYGHQLLAKALGGVVGYHEKGMEIGTTMIEPVSGNGSDPLFNNVAKKFPAHVCHSQTVLQLPANAVLLAKNDFEPTHAFRVGQWAWGVQFHPEYDEKIMKAYVDNLSTPIKASGLDLSAVFNTIEPTPEALGILQRFGRLVE